MTCLRLPIVVFLCVCPYAFAQNAAAWAYGGQVDLNGRYIWRGIPYSEGPVMQPYGWVWAHGFTLTGWGNFVLGHEPGRGTLNQTFFTGPYFRDFGRWRIEPVFQGWESRGLGELGNAATAECAMRFSVGVRHARNLGGTMGVRF